MLRNLSDKIYATRFCALAPLMLLVEIVIFILDGVFSLFRLLKNKVFVFVKSNFVQRYAGAFVVSILLIMVATLYGIWYSNGLGYDVGNDISELKRRADVATTFNSLTALFTGIAMVLLFYTIIVQQQEMHSTRQVMNYQQIENTVFNMISVLNKVVEEVYLVANKNTPERELKGRRAFKSFYLTFKEMYSKTISGKTVQESSEFSWRYVYNKQRAWLPHYFRTLYRVVKYIDDARLYDNADKNGLVKKEIVNTVRGQLSDYELVLLFYNIHSKEGEGFKELCIKYNLLKHLPAQLLLADEHREQLKALSK